MKHYTVIRKQPTGTSTTALYLQPSEDSDAMAYSAGQYVGLSFRRGLRRTPMRCFSITTAPSDTGELGIAFRNRGAYTAALSELTPGSQIEIAGPFGDFTVPRDENRPLMFLAGGIGITPFVSLLRDLVTRRNAPPVTLLYSVNSLQDVPFAPELMDLAKRNSNFTIRFLTSEVPADRQGHPLVIQGRLSDEIIKQYVTTDTLYYICGPGGYASAAHATLENLGVYEWAIHNEAFSQSSKMTVAGFAVQKLVYGLLGVAILIGAGLFSVKGLLKTNQSTTVVPAAATQSSGTTTTPSYSTSTTSTQSTPAVAQQNSYSPPRSMMS